MLYKLLNLHLFNSILMKGFACEKDFNLVATDIFLFFQCEHLLNIFLYGLYLISAHSL